MKYLKSYQLFESILYLSPEFRTILTRFAKENSEEGSPESIATNLLQLEFSDVKPDTTFIDKTKTSNVSFIQMKNAKKLLGEVLPDINKLTKSNVNSLYNSTFNDVFTKSRNEIKIGKLVKSIFLDKYSDKQIEQFVNKYKSILEKPSEVFELVSGDDIAFWYKKDNYLELKGTLGSSCMRNMSDATFRIYTMNSEICQLLILRNLDENKIIGRALIWNINTSNNNITKFMDRIYTTKDSDILKFQEYAKSNDIPTKWRQSHEDLDYISLNGEKVKDYMTVQLKPFKDKDFDYINYPYMDTLRQYNYKTGELNNTDNEEEGYYLLDTTDGTYSIPEENNEDMVYSEYLEDMIHEDEAVYSDALETYLRRSQSTYIDTGNRRNFGWYPNDSDDITKDDWSGRYIHIDDSVYSENLDKTMLAEDAVTIIEEIDYTGNIDSEGIYNEKDEGDDWISVGAFDDKLWYKWLESNNRHLDTYQGISANLVEKEFDNDTWILSKECYEVYLSDDDRNIYLTKFDAKLLETDITKYSYKMCRFDYYQKLSHLGLLSELTELLINEDKRLKSILTQKTSTIEFEEDEINLEYKQKVLSSQKKVSDLIENLEEFTNL